jgi:hypothetical protein
MNHPIIPKPTTHTVYTYNDKYPHGTVNPTERKVITKNLCIDTLFRKNYDKTTSTNFLHILPDPITNVISMNITAMEFPNAWYNFAAENLSNQFTITLYNTPTPSTMQTDDPNFTYDSVITHTIVIPDGNYRSDLLRDAMNNIFLNTGYGLEYIYFDVDEISTKCSFRTKSSNDNVSTIYQNDAVYTASNGEFYFTLDFRVESYLTRPLYKNAGWMLGFKQSYYEVKYSETGYTDMITTDSTLVYNWHISGETSYGATIQNYLFLEIDDFNKNFSTNTLFANTTNETYLGNNIMGRISVVTGMNTIITNTASDCVFKKREYFGPVKLEKLQIRLINKFGDPLPFNGNEFSFVLEIEQLYS